ncbi:MAG: septal ring lytic transglycosylase RlpA family protein [Bdellovibrionia bacterium]
MLTSRTNIIAAALLSLLVSACGSAPTRHSSRDSTESSQASPEHETSRFSKIQRGMASWYGKHFRGRRTASGERFDPKQLTAAHKTLPLGSQAKVTCPKTGKTVVVTINDRGPYSAHRIIDLSREAAKKLGIISLGVALVEVEPIQ